MVEDGELHAGLAVEEVLDVGPLPGAVEPAEHPHLSGSVLVDRDPVGILDLASILGAARGEVSA